MPEPGGDLVRVFVPCTTTLLAGWLADGELPAGTAFAVTPSLREWYAEADTEELEYVAMTSAAQAALRLLDADPTARRRRLVVSADVPSAQVLAAGDDDERAVVALSSAVPVRRWRSAHVDGAEAEGEVALAAENVVAADLGSEAAQQAVDDALGHELMWFATQELAAWLELVDLEG